MKQNIYFRSIPGEVKDEEISDFFSKFGQIKSMKIMTHYVFINGLTEECKKGYVCYSTVMEAEKAKNEANTTQIFGRKIYASIF